MPVIHDFEEQNLTIGGSLPITNKKRYGNGFADILPSLTSFLGNNSELIGNVSNAAKAAGNVASAYSKVTQAVKTAKELGRQKEMQDSLSATKEQGYKKKDSTEVAKILNEHKTFDPQGDGFRKFP